MTLEEEVFQIGKQLEKIVGQDKGAMDPVAARDLLKKLKDLPITLECLQKTRIGMSVNTLRKKSDNGDVQTMAKSLIKSWKKLLPEKSSEKDSKQDNNKPPSNEKSSRSTSPALSTKSDSSETSSLEKKITSFPPATVTKDSVRDKCREMIQNSLNVTEGFEAIMSAEEAASRCENCIFEEFKDTNVKYKQRIRSRVNNLRDPKNPMLKVRLLGGEITPERFATMSSEEMACDELKKLRQEFTKEGIKEAQMAKNAGTETSLFKCGKCGQRKTTYNQLQTRSADEPMTTFVYCMNCGNRWKFC
ncbi:transcription elongation factor A protein 1 [Exaiptasia diaphana]|uniref:Transcription elongation factor n=1 Tax=Exaiptasia diaphana TaxID=2652724 RepID=A0A913WTB9_EXADI|nr:transcription elongation factor A protein 1 [Exaiptasia diaphana]